MSSTRIAHVHSALQQHGRMGSGLHDQTISPWNTPGNDFSDLSAYFDPDGMIISNLNPAGEPDARARPTAGTTTGSRRHSAEPLGSNRQGDLRLQRQQQAVGLLHSPERDRLPSSLDLVGTGMDHSVSLRADRQGNRSRLPGELHSRVQRHDDQRVCLLVLRNSSTTTA